MIFSINCKRLFLLLLAMQLWLAGCVSGEAPPPPKTLQSQTMGTASGQHEEGICTSGACEGENCANIGCHSTDDSQHGVFVVSGTVYQSGIELNTPYTNSNATILFYADDNGSAEAVTKTLPVDAYGNFYTTESLGASAVHPALQDGNRRIFMPRPLVPVAPGSCNFCHNLAQGANDPARFDNVELNTRRYLRINNGLTSNMGSDLSYHSSGDPGPNCLQADCHGSNGTPVFTLAGAVYQTDAAAADTLYTLGDASIGLFSQACEDPPNCLHPDTDPDGNPIIVDSRPKVPKLLLEVNRRGHFYTTQPINWDPITDPPDATPTYPTLANYDASTLCRNVRHMPTGIPGANAGDCYSCHDGTTQPFITISAVLNDVENCNP